jgi:hypothetical protein
MGLTSQGINEKFFGQAGNRDEQCSEKQYGGQLIPVLAPQYLKEDET